MLFAANQEAAFAILAVAGVVILGVLIIMIFFHITLMKAIQACAPRNQAMPPGLVWLGFVPCLSLVWNFVNVIQVGNSLQAEYRDRGMPTNDESFGKTLGLSFLILGLVSSGINFVARMLVEGSDSQELAGGVLCLQGILSIVQLILFITYWVKIAGFTRELGSSSGRSRHDDDRGYDRDERRSGDDRRSRYDDDRGSRSRSDAVRTDVTCPACNAKVNIAESNLGQDLWCPMCARPFTATVDEPPRATRRDDLDDEAPRPREGN